MQRATIHFQSQGFIVEDVSSRKPYDLLCTRLNEEVYVEVKGTRGAGDRIILTSGEVRFAKENADSMVLFVVSGIEMDDGEAQGGRDKIVKPWQIDDESLEPMSLWYVLD
ncbi:MAG: DUF3883 domain-containing protein [Phycisphaerales bacterium]